MTWRFISLSFEITVDNLPAKILLDNSLAWLYTSQCSQGLWSSSTPRKLYGKSASGSFLAAVQCFGQTPSWAEQAQGPRGPVTLIKILENRAGSGVGGAESSGWNNSEVSQAMCKSTCSLSVRICKMGVVNTCPKELLWDEVRKGMDGMGAWQRAWLQQR